MNLDCLSAHNAVWWFTLLAALIVILGFVVASLRKEVKKMSKAFDGLKVSITTLEATVAEAVAKLGTPPVIPPTDAPTEAEIAAEAGRVDKLNTDLQAVLHPPPPPPPPPAGAPNTAESAGGPGSGFLVNE